METVSSEYFHGTNGDNILNIIEKGQLFPGILFFSASFRFPVNRVVPAF
jgi:hypothetical protein